MQEGTPSVTARVVAQVRAGMDRPVTPDGDGTIEQRLVERFPSGRRSPLADRLERRTRWFDDVTLRGIEDGVGQIVIVAAGYDCRALRFRTSGVRFIELDHPATQGDKQRILGDMGADVSDVTYVAADFTKDDVALALATGGHDPGMATLFLVEGLLIYLSEEVIVSLLTALRACAMPASRMAVSFSGSRPPEFYAAVASVGEQARSTFSEEEARTLLHTCGWDGNCTGLLFLASPV